MKHLFTKKKADVQGYMCIDCNAFCAETCSRTCDYTCKGTCDYASLNY